MDQSELNQNTDTSVLDTQDVQEIQEVQYVNDTINNIQNIEYNEDKEDKELVHKIAKDTEYLKQIMEKLNAILGADGEKIANAELITNEADVTIQETQETIKDARNSQKKSMLLKGTILSTFIGACIGGPIGGIMGSSIHLTAMGTILGGVSVGGFMGSIAHFSLKST